MESLIYFLLVAALFVLMMRFGCGAHVLGHGHGHGGRGRPGQDEPTSAVDPVCGMTVQPRSAKTSLHRGAAYYFCSAACRDQFEAAPDSYTSGKSPLSKSQERGHDTHH